MTNLEKYTKSFVDSFDVDPDAVPTLAYQTIPTWDSIGHMALMAVLEETVPVQQIWLDTAEDPDNPTRPFAGTTDRQIGQIIREAYDAIRRNQGLTHDQTIGLLMSMEEFSEQDAVIATLEDRS